MGTTIGFARTILLGAGVLMMTDASGQDRPKKLFLFANPDSHQWCINRNQEHWKSQVESRQALLFSILEFENNHISLISFIEDGESGDWSVYDDYTIDANGNIRKLTRQINVIPGTIRAEQTYRIADGKAAKVTDVRHSLGDLIRDNTAWVPEPRIRTRIQDFPFASILAGKHPEVWTKDGVCVK
jgi:hypothetical protein